MGLLNFLRRKNANVLDTPDKILNALCPWAIADSGINVTPAVAMQITTAYACVKVLAESVGMLPMSLFKVDGQHRNKAIKHPLNTLLKMGFNELMTAQEYKELIIVHLAMRGNHYSWINRLSNGVIAELLPLKPESVTPRLSTDWVLTYDVVFPDGSKRTLPANEILHIRLFSNDGINGLSPISQNRHALGLAKATERHGSKLFTNAARPSGGFKTSNAMKQEQVDDLKEQLGNYAGEGALKNLILQGGLEWFQTSMSSEDSQFLQTRQFQRSEICAMFRVPPHMVADLEKATFSNIEHQGLEFVTNSLMPYLTRIEERIEKSLLTKQENTDHYVKFNANALLRGDMKSRADFYTRQIQNGAISPNEIRALEDMNPRDGGDVYLTPMNMLINGKPAGESENEN